MTLTLKSQFKAQLTDIIIKFTFHIFHSDTMTRISSESFLERVFVLFSAHCGIKRAETRRKIVLSKLRVIASLWKIWNRKNLIITIIATIFLRLKCQCH